MGKEGREGKERGGGMEGKKDNRETRTGKRKRKEGVDKAIVKQGRRGEWGGMRDGNSEGMAEEENGKGEIDKMIGKEGKRKGKGR